MKKSFTEIKKDFIIQIKMSFIINLYVLFKLNFNLTEYYSES